MERPKKQKYIANYYRLNELEELFEVTKDHPYSLLIQTTAFYGLRRSESLGLKWDAIDFERNAITIKHIVTEVQVDGKSVIISEDRAKTKSSLRSLPLVGHFSEKLPEPKEQQKKNKRVCGNCYNYKYDGYIFVDVILMLSRSMTFAECWAVSAGDLPTGFWLIRRFGASKWGAPTRSRKSA